MSDISPLSHEGTAQKNAIWRQSYDGYLSEYQSLAGRLRSAGKPYEVPALQLSGTLTEQFDQLKAIVEGMREAVAALTQGSPPPPPPPPPDNGARLALLERAINQQSEALSMMHELVQLKYGGNDAQH